MAKKAKVRIGISGWRYAPWRGVFYPKDLRQKDELAYAADIFNTIEINGTFYSLQRPASFRAWRDETPPDFVFAVKGPRYITHMLRLNNVDAALANFFASGILLLEQKLGPVCGSCRPTSPSSQTGWRRFSSHCPAPQRRRPASPGVMTPE